MSGEGFIYCLVFKSRETKIEDKTFLVLMRLGDTPVPIPNTMVKTYYAGDGMGEQVAAGLKKKSFMRMFYIDAGLTSD